MSDYFDRIELELRAAVLRAAPSSTSRRRRVPRLGGVATAAGAVGAAALAAIALVSLGHRRQPGSERTTGRGAPSYEYHACFPVHGPDCLIAQYAVLREPAHGALPAVPGPVVPSMFFGGQAVHQAHVRLLPQFNRAVRIGQTNTILFVAKSSLGPPNYYLGAFFVVNGRATYVAENWPYLPLPSNHGQSARSVLLWSYSRWVRGYEETVVPDPVARVRWTFPPHRQRAAHAVYADVHNNVAVAAVPHRVNSPVLTEYGRSGRVLAVQYQLPFGFKPGRRGTLAALGKR